MPCAAHPISPAATSKPTMSSAAPSSDRRNAAPRPWAKVAMLASMAESLLCTRGDDHHLSPESLDTKGRARIAAMRGGAGSRLSALLAARDAWLAPDPRLTGLGQTP